MTRPSEVPDEVLRALLQQYGALIRKIVARVGGRVLRDNRDDVAQSVAMSLWQQISREQEISHPSSYIYRAAVRETVREVRRRLEEEKLHAPIDGAVEPSSGAPNPERAAAAQQVAQGIEEAIGGLLPDRAVAVRANLAGYSVEEIMAVQGWPYQKARNLIARGMADLRDELKKGGFGD